MNLQAALDFIAERGDPAEQARLKVLYTGEPPAAAAVDALLSGQHSDGGWPPFWAPDYSSLDATCFRLAQARQLRVDASDPRIARGLGFLTGRQAMDGSWQEAEWVAPLAPPWAAPGDPRAALYLTANCGYWLALLGAGRVTAERASNHLLPSLRRDGGMPSFLHAHWLAAGLWYCLDSRDPAARVFRYLEKRLAEMHTSNLAWLIVTLRDAGVPARHRLIQHALEKLLLQQRDIDGCWPSEDGPARDVHSTLEALYALKISGQIAFPE
ncbi:MAG: prenyltransferase/squalene oxidase repeat-containing protein [Bacteroidota bacterium]